MPQVKTFEHYRAKDLDVEINSFLGGSEIGTLIDIKYSSTTYLDDTGEYPQAVTQHTAMVLYHTAAEHENRVYWNNKSK